MPGKDQQPQIIATHGVSTPEDPLVKKRTLLRGVQRPCFDVFRTGCLQETSVDRSVADGGLGIGLQHLGLEQRYHLLKTPLDAASHCHWADANALSYFFTG